MLDAHLSAGFRSLGGRVKDAGLTIRWWVDDSTVGEGMCWGCRGIVCGLQILPTSEASRAEHKPPGSISSQLHQATTLIRCTFVSRSHKSRYPRRTRPRTIDWVFSRPSVALLARLPPVKGVSGGGGDFIRTSPVSVSLAYITRRTFTFRDVHSTWPPSQMSENSKVRKKR
jgi:hypothetical protein